MPRRLVRFSLALALLLSSQAFALGLGEIRINSALNEPLRAEIELLSASPEELDGLRVVLASEATFERYGIERPFYLSEIVFEVVKSGRSGGNVIRVTSPSPVTEPFLTFLVEASWSSGRLLREYTVLLDPPTFAPPAASQPAPVVAAPQRSEPSDTARIERSPAPAEAAPAQPAPAPAPVRPATTSAPADAEPDYAEPEAAEPPPESPPTQAVEDSYYDSTPGGDVVVQRGDTLWGIASRMRPDAGLTMNQTMLAIFEANPDAFGGNINMLRAGATLRMPSADDIFRIDRGEAFREAQRQNEAWSGGYTPAESVVDTAPVETAPPSLQLVPPDEDVTAVDTGTDSAVDAEPLTREQEILDRIAELEAENVSADPALISINDNELATLRQELANIRGEVYEPPVDPTVADDAAVDDAGADDPFVEDSAAADATAADDAAITDEVTDAEADETKTIQPAPAVRRTAPSLVDRILGWVTSIYAMIGAIVLIAVGVLLWFLRRDKGDEEPDDWQPLEDEGEADDDLDGTETLRVPDRTDESFVVEEQEPALAEVLPTIESPAFSEGAEVGQSGTFGSLEDTFSSETAVNLDQSDPIAEADFHMAYGLYDQAAELVNGALESEPGRQDLLSKLCEIYFVWGNRDAFVDAADRLKSAVGGGESVEWDKIVIMGQQIAGDHDLFAGAGTAAATKEMDLSLDTGDSGGVGALDMDFGDDVDSGNDDVIDLGGESPSPEAEVEGGDFLFDQAGSSTNDSNVLDIDFDTTAESPTLESPVDIEVTRDMDTLASTLESPTIEEQFDLGAATAELPSLDDTSMPGSIDSSSTAEIDLDDLDLDVSGLVETEVPSLGDLDATGTNEALPDSTDVTDSDSASDPDAQVAMSDDPSASVLGESIEIDDELSLTGTMRLAPDETGVNPMITPVEEAASAFLDDDMLAALGTTEVLPEDFAVQTGTSGDAELGADDATLLAGPEDDDGDFDFAKTEALMPDAFAGSDSGIDATGELPVASTDVDLDLDDLTAALQVSAGGDTVNMPRGDATVEQPRPDFSDTGSMTMTLDSGDMGEDLDDARTMTEVGTKLDLARAYIDMGDPGGARSILEEVLDEGDEAQRQQAQSLLDSLPA